MTCGRGAGGRVQVGGVQVGGVQVRGVQVGGKAELEYHSEYITVGHHLQRQARPHNVTPPS